MPEMFVSKSISIKASPPDVFRVLTDFKEWPSWSPWLIAEPDAKLTFSEDAKYYHWEGKRVGTGDMAIRKEKENRQVDYDLTFIKPWKSEAKVSFLLSKEAEETYLTWTLKSSLPFFMFFMKGMMETFIGMDFERGLKLLKDYMELGEVQSKLDFDGTKTFEGAKFVGIKSTASFKDISLAMKHDFGKLGEYAKENSGNLGDKMFCVYHKMDIKNKSFTYTACLGVKEIPTEVPTGYTMGQVNPSKVFVVRHTGPYHHLGNAWSAGSMIERSKEYQKNKRFDPIEMYVNNPAEVEEKDLVTELFFGIK